MDPILWIVVGVVALLLGGGGYFYLRGRRPPQEEAYASFNCPHCKRKLRYLVKRAGRPGECPRCHKRLTFPAVGK
jgi:hypothetical protein